MEDNLLNDLNAKTVGLLIAALIAIVGCRGKDAIPIEPVENTTSGLPKLACKAIPEGYTPKPEEMGQYCQPGEGKVKAGPTMMGYEYYVRASYGIMSGTYSDSHENASTGRGGTEETKVPGTRYSLEYYPNVGKSGRSTMYGYIFAELRNEAPEKRYWEKRETAVVLLGYILKNQRLIVPVFGMHAEFNKIDISDDESPEVMASDIRTHVLGLHARQKIWGTGDHLSCFYTGKFHFLNLSRPSWGYEIDVSLGSAIKYGFFRTDLAVGYLYRNYEGTSKSAEDDGKMLDLKSVHSAPTATATFWF